MKHVIILGDGMSDYPIPSLGGRTPLEAAYKPNMDFLARSGECGLATTIPEGMSTGSDTANLSVMGYDPARFYTGRSPLEAVSMGIDLKPDDVTFRCNLVTLSEEADYRDCTMLDYSSGEITSAEAEILIRDAARALCGEGMTLYPGISYRHCLVLSRAKTGTDCTPPHDILTRRVADYLPQGRYAEILLDMMIRSRDILRDHPVNRDRIARGLNPGSSLWLWGEGTRPALPAFFELYGLTGAVVSAVDLIKGIGICAGLRSIDVEGATGTIDTNYMGKADAAIEALRSGCDFVYVHIEAPDECGHHADIEGKVRSIELIDREIVAPILTALRDSGEDFTLMTLPDHPTPISLRTHTRDSVPFALYRSWQTPDHPATGYSEACAGETGLYVPSGVELMRRFVGKK